MSMKSPVYVPITSFSTSTRLNHAGKPLWEHLSCGSRSCVSFESSSASGNPHTPSPPVELMSVFVEGVGRERVSLQHLAKLAEVDAKNGSAGNDRAANFNLVVRKPLLAMKYVNESFEVRRFQVKFDTASTHGFDHALERLERHGLIAKQAEQAPKQQQDGSSKQEQQSAKHVDPGATIGSQYPMAQPNEPSSQKSADSLRQLAPSLQQSQSLVGSAIVGQGRDRLDSTLWTASYQAQQSRSSTSQADLQSQSAPKTSNDSGFANVMHPRQMINGNTSDMYASPGLTDKPVGRRLSFSTPPSSQLALLPQSHVMSPTLCTAQGPNQVDMPTIPSQVSLQPSPMLNNCTALGHSNRPAFFQRLSPLRNEVIVSSYESQASVAQDIMVTVANGESTRPWTAPAYPGSSQTDIVPPKRKLPFATPQGSKKTRESKVQKEAKGPSLKPKANTRPKTAAGQKRPSTSPGDLEKSKVASENQPKAKRTRASATKSVCAVDAMAVDPAVHSFIEDQDVESQKKVKPRDTTKAQVSSAKAAGERQVCSYRSVGTQALLLSLPTTKEPKEAPKLAPVEEQLLSDPNSMQIAAMSDLMRTIDKLLLDQTQPQVSVSRTDRDEAIGMRLCKLLVDDEFLVLCDEVEKVCSRMRVSV